jgi:hypothetical protein
VVPLHQLVLLAGQPPLLEQYPIGNGHLADVVEIRLAMERVQMSAKRGRVLFAAAIYKTYRTDFGPRSREDPIWHCT